jgi:hypothetical protein
LNGALAAEVIGQLLQQLASLPEVEEEYWNFIGFVRSVYTSMPCPAPAADGHLIGKLGYISNAIGVEDSDFLASS